MRILHLNGSPKVYASHLKLEYGLHLSRSGVLQSTAFNAREVDEIIQDKAKSGAEMRRTLGWFQLMCMGIGAIIGSGIYVL